jgi:hypothetical protein
MKWSLYPHAFAIVAAGALLAGFWGCKVQKGDGANKKLDMETSVGSVHLNTQVDPKDTGLAVYPGATRTEEDDKHAANFSIDSSLFGAKLVAIKYHSDDSPEKVLDFYRKQLRAYGEVTECHGKVDIAGSEARCLSGLGEETNLLTGTQERRHVVSVKADGKGSKFALMYLQTHRGSGPL